MSNRAGSDLRHRSALPVAVPSKIVCVGLNYRPHAREANMALPQAPLLFAKWPSALIGPDDEIRIPSFVTEVDYEAELGVVIGRHVRDCSEEDALLAVDGYVCLNDVSARDAQLGDGQWTRGKSFDTFCPVGPRVVPAADVPDPQDVVVRCLVNDEVVQEDSTANMVFSVAEIIAYASRRTTLHAGDIIATGTPAGVQLGRAVPRWLQPGDVVSVEITGIGTLTNPVVAA